MIILMIIIIIRRISLTNIHQYFDFFLQNFVAWSDHFIPNPLPSMPYSAEKFKWLALDQMIYILNTEIVMNSALLTYIPNITSRSTWVGSPPSLIARYTFCSKYIIYIQGAPKLLRLFNKMTLAPRF